MKPDDHDSTLPLLPAGIARGEGRKKATLIGGYCPDCRRDYFPRPRYCPACLRPAEARDLSGDGAIYSFTVVRTKAPFGLPQPYAVGFVDLDASGLRVFGLLNPRDIDRLAIGHRVRLSVGPLGDDGKEAPCLRPYFSLATGEDDNG